MGGKTTWKGLNKLTIHFLLFGHVHGLNAVESRVLLWDYYYFLVR